MPKVTPEQQEALDFVKKYRYFSLIKNAIFSFKRSTEITKWGEDEAVPLDGEVNLDGHIPAFVINNERLAKYTARYQAPGITCIVKFGEREHRNSEQERRVSVVSTVCRDTEGLYLIVRLWSVDGRTHIPGKVFTFNSRLNENLQDWITEKIKLSADGTEPAILFIPDSQLSSSQLAKKFPVRTFEPD